MSSTIDFNEAAGHALERAYLPSDVIEQRARVLEILALAPGEHVLDIACGPGYHARTAARMGLRAIGMDLRPEMLDFAQKQAPDAPVEWYVGNMCDFHLDEPVDMAAVV